MNAWYGMTLWGEATGSMSMTDAISGATATFDGLTLESWPKF